MPDRSTRARFAPRIAALALALVIAGPAAPAFADPAEPTDYRSVVDATEPPTSAVEISVVGGDAFLRIDVSPGHEVVVLGYWDEPYARVSADGTVAVNASSPSVVQNTSRYGVATEERADPGAAPRWEPTGDRGSFVWHDHRSHWMAPAKAATTTGGLVQRWELPLVVDGESVTVHGSLYRHDSPSSSWWFVVVLGAAALALTLPRARAPIVVVAGLAGAVTGLLDGLSLPAAARPGWAPAVLGMVAAAAGAASWFGRGSWWRPAVLAGAGAALATMGWLQRDTLTHAYLPGPSPDGLVRFVVAVALGAGIVTALASAAATTGIQPSVLRPAAPRPTG